MRRSKGFTLIEILIVIVIFAILASLILPRMQGQVERAETAEAFELMGVMRRAAAKMYSMTGTYSGSLDAAAGAGPATSGSWEVLGLQEPSGIKRWRVRFLTGPWYFSARVSDDSGNNMSCTNYWGPVAWACAGVFKPVTDGAGNVIGCTI